MIVGDIMATKNRGGRKSKYETHVKPRLPEIMEMCRTMTETQIAEALGIGASTFQAYKTEFPELQEALKKGKQTLVAELRSSLIKKANGYDYVETKVVTEDVKWPDELYAKLIEAGFTPAQINQAKLVRTEVYKKQASPDVAALNLALKNYDKDNWANDPQALELKKKELKLKEQQAEKDNW